MRHNIHEKGYGYIPRLIMEDRRLSALSKSIYAYFCSFSEGKASLFPPQDKIIADLNMTEEVYRTHFQLLVRCGYISLQQEKRSDGGVRNIFTLQKQIDF